jgi:hypothetical protein
MALSDIFRSVRMRKERDDIPEALMAGDKLVMGAVSVGHILEISNGYVIVLISPENFRNTAIYVPTLDKIGEALAANRTRNKFLNDPNTPKTTR